MSTFAEQLSSLHSSGVSGASHGGVICWSVSITLDAAPARYFFQSKMAALLALLDKKAHSGFGLVSSLKASSHAHAYSPNVGASPLVQKSWARIPAIAPFRNRPPVKCLGWESIVRFVLSYCPQHNLSAAENFSGSESKETTVPGRHVSQKSHLSAGSVGFYSASHPCDHRPLFFTYTHLSFQWQSYLESNAACRRI